MSIQAGWYPDPGGQQGLYRYWDGQTWSAATTTNPQAAPPSQGLVPQQAGPGQGGYNPYQPQGGGPLEQKKSPIGWWIGAGVILIALVVLAAFFVRGAVNNINTPGGGGSGGPVAELCPVDKSQATAAPKQYNDGRVHGGALSYPRLPAPWGAPEGDIRVPFGRDVMTQNASVHQDYNAAKDDWVASVLVAELIAGDGFFSPQDGAQIVVKCVTGTFYGEGTEVTREDTENRATTVDGQDAWTLESHLTFDIEGLPTKGELLIVVIVASDDATSSLFYASIPDDSPQYVQPARDALKQLKVE